ncbi:MAG: phosphoribosylglycinamide formyltransferase [Sediminibacterium sp.]|nr:phosphoribosylglycinamide formyltransferase [Sediminibacterium sp.]
MKFIQNLQEKWKVGGSQFWLIMLTFALGGSLSGRLCSFLLNLVFLEKNWAFWLVYPLFLTILWPFSVLFVSFFTGQFRFFKGYLSRVGAKVFGIGASVVAPSTVSAAPATSSVSSAAPYFSSAAPIHIAIFASGTGSNARKIIEYFEGAGLKSTSSQVKVSLIVCNVPDAGVLAIAKEKGIPTLLINKYEFATTGYVESLHNADIQFIVLAGFLWKVPEVLVQAYQPGMKIDGALVNGKENVSKGIINIHPALLPKYGGKGMYGSRVHEAVIAAGEKESGITIHWVNEHYDEGGIIFQATCEVVSSDTPDTLADKIHALEHAHFAPTIAKLLG